MSKEYENTQKDSALVRETFNFLQNENIELSLDNVKNLLQNAPFVKDLFIKITDTTEISSQNVFDVFKKPLLIYEDELKREDLTDDQRVNIYDRIDNYAINAMKQDDSNKRFLAGVAGMFVTVVVGSAIRYGPRIVKSVIKK